MGTDSKIPNTYGIRNDVHVCPEGIESSQPSMARRMLCRYLSLERWYRTTVKAEHQ